MYFIRASLLAFLLSPVFGIPTSAKDEHLAVVERQSPVRGTATVSLAQTSATPAFLASGFIYGIPDNQDQISTQIPDHFFTDIKFKYCRAGGAQLPAPNRGWIFGLQEYKGRFASTLSNYRTSRKFGARFILLVHDLWGADSLQSDSAVFPGDNNDWSSYDAFITQLIADIKANNMLVGLDIDIWNEPDIPGFWTRGIDRWLAMWHRGYPRLKSSLPGVLLTGPSTAAPPSVSNPWWAAFGHYVQTNAGTPGVIANIPDVYTWHNLAASYDPAASVPELATWRAAYGGLPVRALNINEYGGIPEQSPSFAAWYIARLERYNIAGLRANWASAFELHDYMGNLLGKPGAGTPQYQPGGTGYYPAGEWHVYKYYANMTGIRVATAGSEDRVFDVYATRWNTADTVKILAGSRGKLGRYDITVKGLEAVGLPATGEVGVRTRRFDYNGKYGQVGEPVDMGVYRHPISNGQITFWVEPPTIETSYAFELVL